MRNIHLLRRQHFKRTDNCAIQLTRIPVVGSQPGLEAAGQSWACFRKREDHNARSNCGARHQDDRGTSNARPRWSLRWAGADQPAAGRLESVWRLPSVIRRACRHARNSDQHPRPAELGCVAAAIDGLRQKFQFNKYYVQYMNAEGPSQARPMGSGHRPVAGHHVQWQTQHPLGVS